MKMFALVLLCSLICVGCAKQMTTLSDSRPGYAVNCDTLRERCIDEITRACRGKGYMIISERAQEVRLPERWPGPGPFTPGYYAPHNSRYWIEARCDQF